MNGIGIANKSYDIDGNAVLKPIDIDLLGGQRRATRTRTLDGGVVITDGGFAHGDRTLNVTVTHTDALKNILWALFQNANQIVVTTDDGAFLATFQGMTASDGKIKLSIWVKEIIST